MAKNPHVVLGGLEASSARAQHTDAGRAWRWLGWFALVLTIVGVGDWVLAWIPLRLGTPEWEFGTVVSSISGLPLVTMGFAGVMASAMARGVRWQIRTVGMLLLVWGLWVLAALIVFALDVPVALRAVDGPARLGIMKAIAKTLTTGGLFFVTYLVAGIAALRQGSR